VSIVIPTLNAVRDLPACLASIRMQAVRRQDYEVIVVDGGSSDETRLVAEDAGARLVNNPYGKAEPGVAVGVQASRGRFVTVMAADNRMSGSHFIEHILAPFADSDVVAAFPRVISTTEDGLASRYINRYSDPFNHFVYGSLSTSIDLMLSRGARTICCSVNNHPLLAVAQGCTLRTGLVYGESPDEADDVLAIIQLIEAGGKLALVSDAAMEHHSTQGLASLYRKYWRRTRDALKGRQGYRRRSEKMTRNRRMRRWVWLPYSASLLAPIIHGGMLALRHRDPIALYHPIVNTVVFAAVLRGGVAALLNE
jgi:glycosyltransferase involved in cell wall biosynthesis